jgi:LacI family transcriptional regulator
MRRIRVAARGKGEPGLSQSAISHLAAVLPGAAVPVRKGSEFILEPRFLTGGRAQSGRMKIPRVALLIESSRTYGRGILRGIAQYAHVHGPWSFFIQERELQSGMPAWLQNWKGQGVIARIEDRRTARALLRLGCPVIDVLGNAPFAGIPGFDTDAEAVAGLAADFLLRAGFRHFAFCGYRGIPFSDRREAAFREHLARQRHAVCVFSARLSELPASRIQAVELRGLGAEKVLALWLRKQPRPLGLFACNDVRAQQVLNACREYGIKVPEEVAVMAVDNDDVLCNLCDPPLSSIEPDTERIGYEAAELLNRLMRGRAPKTSLTQVPPARIVERASTDVVPIEDAITVQAVRFIRDQVNEGIAVKDVLRHVGRSRSDLEMRFRRWLKTTVRGEIQRRRMERVCQLLQQTDFNLEQVAAGSGFASAAHLCRLFREHLHQTPSDYRQSCKIRQ